MAEDILDLTGDPNVFQSLPFTGVYDFGRTVVDEVDGIYVFSTWSMEREHHVVSRATASREEAETILQSLLLSNKVPNAR